MVPTNVRQKSVRVVHAQFVPRYMYRYVFGIEPFTARCARFHQKNRFGPLGTRHCQCGSVYSFFVVRILSQNFAAKKSVMMAEVSADI